MIEDVFVILREISVLVIMLIRDCWILMLLFGQKSKCNMSSKLEQQVQFGAEYR